MNLHNDILTHISELLLSYIKQKTDIESIIAQTEARIQKIKQEFLDLQKQAEKIKNILSLDGVQKYTLNAFVK